MHIVVTGIRRRPVWQMTLGVSQQHTAAIIRVSSANTGCSEELKSHSEGDRSALGQQHLPQLQALIRHKEQSYIAAGNCGAAWVRTHRYWEHRQFVNANFIIIIIIIIIIITGVLINP